MSDKEVAMRLEKICSLLAAAIPSAHVNLLFEEIDNKDYRYEYFFHFPEEAYMILS